MVAKYIKAVIDADDMRDFSKTVIKRNFLVYLKKGCCKGGLSALNKYGGKVNYRHQRWWLKDIWTLLESIFFRVLLLY
jgi:hypothetical protein